MDDIKRRIDHDEIHNRNLIRTEEHLGISVNNDHSNLDALNESQNPKIDSNSKSTKSHRIYSGLNEEPRLHCKKTVNQRNTCNKPLIKNSQKITEQKNEILSRTFDLLKIKKLIKTFFYFILILLIFNSQLGVDSAPVKTNETSLIHLNQELTNHRTFSYYDNDHLLAKRQVKGRKQRRIINKNCKEYDITSRAYLADLIFEGTARSRSSGAKGRYDVTFSIQRILKQKNNTYKPKSQIRLHFGGRASRRSSQYNLLNDCPINSITSSKIQKANVKVGGKYYVFAERFGPGNYTAKGDPIVINKRNLKSIRSVISRNSRGFLIPEKPPRVRGLQDLERSINSELRLSCQIRGRPVPRINWFKDGVPLIPSSHVNVTYYRKNSTIEIKSLTLQDRGRYECRATNVKGQSATISAYVNVSPFYTENTTTSRTTEPDWPFYGEKCQREEYCLNQGICRFIPSLGEHMCICKVGFKGQRCEIKEVTAGNGDYGDPLQRMKRFLCKKLGKKSEIQLGKTQYLSQSGKEHKNSRNQVILEKHVRRD